MHLHFVIDIGLNDRTALVRAFSPHEDFLVVIGPGVAVDRVGHSTGVATFGVDSSGIRPKGDVAKGKPVIAPEGKFVLTLQGGIERHDMYDGWSGGDDTPVAEIDFTSDTLSQFKVQVRLDTATHVEIRPAVAAKVHAADGLSFKVVAVSVGRVDQDVRQACKLAASGELNVVPVREPALGPLAVLQHIQRAAARRDVVKVR